MTTTHTYTGPAKEKPTAASTTDIQLTRSDSACLLVCITAVEQHRTTICCTISQLGASTAAILLLRLREMCNTSTTAISTSSATDLMCCAHCCKGAVHAPERLVCISKRAVGLVGKLSALVAAAVVVVAAAAAAVVAAAAASALETAAHSIS
eukprot:2677-Heterococcus_DN1.PRE.2